MVMDGFVKGLAGMTDLTAGYDVMQFATRDYRLWCYDTCNSVDRHHNTAQKPINLNPSNDLSHFIFCFDTQ